jgi:alkaline phosphatase
MPCRGIFTGQLKNMIMMKKLFFLVVILVSLWDNSWAQRKVKTHDPNKPLNVIIIIEEGLGLPALSAAQFVKGSDLNVANSTAVGMMKTSSANDVVADPAALGTAIACGVKTTNGTIGMDSQLEKVPNIFELAKKKNMSIGLITTSFVVDAIPAAFYSHQPKNTNYNSIASDLIASGMDVFIGGGKKYFRSRGDSTTLFKDLSTHDYKVLEDYGDLKTKSHKKIAGLLRADAMQDIRNGRGDYLNLAWLRAFKTLIKNDTGYVLVIHNAHINWAAANNEKKDMIAEILDMDKLLETVLNYTLPNQKTLILVIGGFETGGVSVMGNNNSKTDPNMKFSTKLRTASMVPVFAFGTGSSLFSGIYDNTDIFLKIKSLIE